ncbi:cytochrome c [Paracoccus sp. Z330]|uniref:Cytochrome c n=1 Tax=Paracoccus onchidii TaxID=3017813 RepID=A0ABT4Z9W7_9RHOB|nr:cytochrome c [Paracoccus onchidii]MDB6176148.1 cytochrome c [Paracoccus onchidii]
MRQTILGGVGFLAVAGVIVACAPDAQITTARKDYQQFCADCHGRDGKGDGALAASLDPRPADLTQIAARNGGSFPESRVMSHIDGYTTGTTHSAMPAFGDLLEGRTVLYDSGDGIETPTPWRLVALMEYLEGMQEG